MTAEKLILTAITLIVFLIFSNMVFPKVKTVFEKSIKLDVQVVQVKRR